MFKKLAFIYDGLSKGLDMASNIPWLQENFPEVEPLAFYRELFPLGCLDKRDVMTRGKYGAIAIQVEGRKAKRFTLTDELGNLEELISSDTFTIISPCAYAGKRAKADMLREVYALAIDLDNVAFNDERPDGIKSLFSQIDRAKSLPRPTFVVASSPRNLHLYYLLDEPIKTYAHARETLANYKTWLTSSMWNRYVTKDYDHCQQEPLTQGMRAVGSVCKKPEDGRVRAFKCGDRVSIEYLNSFAPSSAKIELSPPPSSKKKREYKTRGKYISHPGLYRWFLGQTEEKANIGHRYFACMCCAIFARKCGIPYEELERDVLGLVPLLDLRSTPDNPFSEEDALKAITAYHIPKYHFMRRETLVRLSAIEMTPSKRNGRTVEDNLKIARGIKNIRIELGETSVIGGAPTKENLVLEYIEKHQKATVTEIARALNISRTTVYKWMKR